MAITGFWMFKWSATAFARGRKGDFTQLLCKARRFRAGGFGSPKCSAIWKRIRTGDIVFCYQSERKDIVGIARIVRKANQKDGTAHVDLQPLRYFRDEINIHAYKSKFPRLRAAACLRPGGRQMAYRVTNAEAQFLSRVCRIQSLLGYRTTTAPLKINQQANRPASKLKTLLVSQWVDQLLVETGGDRMIAYAKAARHADPWEHGSQERKLWDRICDSLQQLTLGSSLVQIPANMVQSTQYRLVKNDQRQGVGRASTGADPIPSAARIRELNSDEAERTNCSKCSTQLQTKHLERHLRYRCPDKASEKRPTPPAKFDGEASEWTDRLLGQRGDDPHAALDDAEVVARQNWNAPIQTRELWDAVCRQLRENIQQLRDEKTRLELASYGGRPFKQDENADQQLIAGAGTDAVRLFIGPRVHAANSVSVPRIQGFKVTPAWAGSAAGRSAGWMVCPTCSSPLMIRNLVRHQLRVHGLPDTRPNQVPPCTPMPTGNSDIPRLAARNFDPPRLIWAGKR